MPLFTPIRAGLLLAATCPAFSQIPPTPPTQTATPAASTAPAAEAQLAPSHRPQVTFATGVLSVSAENSSLNQILREVSRVTGMKITGGVTDERVYGTYGPADTSTVLSALLRGTGSNMLLIFDSRQTPQELILTSRGGGPTPPSPMAAGRDERDRDDDLPPNRMPRNPRPGNFNPPPTVAAPAPQPIQAPAPNATPAAATDRGDPTTQKSPSGVSTPEEIYQQLIKLQQQKTLPTPPPH
jgi:hypothetical protein